MSLAHCCGNCAPRLGREARKPTFWQPVDRRRRFHRCADTTPRQDISHDRVRLMLRPIADRMTQADNTSMLGTVIRIKTGFNS